MHTIGSIIAGKYRITRALGAGGMGAVFKADNVSIGRTVAVKLLHPHLADDEVSLARFQREARTAASVAHRNLVEILDLGVEPSGMPYMVMEYVRGRSLADALKTDGRFDAKRSTYIAGQILAVLASVHEQGIIHRDLKPENILLTTRDRKPDFVKVLDFGVAALSEGAEQFVRTRDLTPSGRVMGSPHYTSPEQIRGKTVRDPRIDLWSVGVLLYQMLSGHRPFSSTRLDELCQSILKDPPPTFRSYGVDVEPALAAVVIKALEKDVEARYQSAASMIEALVPFGAEPLRFDDPEPTDTFTLDLRDIRLREIAKVRADRRSEPPRMGGSAVSGRFTNPAREFVKSRVPQEVISQALGATKAEVHARFIGPMDADGWYSDSWWDFLERIDTKAARGDRRMLASIGREIVRRSEPEEFLAATPELAFDRLPVVWSLLFKTGRPFVETCSRGLGRLRIDEQSDARLARSIAFVGVVEEVLRRSDAHRVDVRLAKSVVLGDEFDRIEASWASE